MKRLYWTDPDVFEVEVIVKPLGDACVSIDPIVFHPEEGGQPADRGTIGPARVVSIGAKGQDIVHQLDTPLEDGVYLARVDRQFRHYCAAQHTAQHILSGLAEQHHDLQTTGVHLGLERSTIDFDKALDWPALQALETEAMGVVCENIQVQTLFDPADVRSRFDLQALEGQDIRVVKIGSYDASACCGVHVVRTGDIGIIRILDIEKKRQGTRVSFCAGPKALAFSQHETSVLRELRRLSKCSTGELPQIMQKHLDSARQAGKALERLQAQQLPGLAADAPVVELGSERIGIQVDVTAPKLTGKLAALIAEQVKGAGIVVSDMRFSIHSNQGTAQDLFTKLKAALGAKGGASPQAANGKLDKPTTVDEITRIIRGTG
jgi:alanyl-tRNA synthetase